jgi:hypothetical protein
MSWAVNCPSCHRQERWQPEGPTVEMEGGQRQPEGHPHLAAWRTVRRSLDGELGPIVGRCSACDQPLVALDSACPETINWTFKTPAGDYQVHKEVLGPSGPIPLDEFDAYMSATYREQPVARPAQTLFTMMVLTLMTVPILLWITTGIIVAIILFNFTSSTQVFVPDF